MTCAIRLLTFAVGSLLLVTTGCGGALTEPRGDPELTESRSGLAKGSDGSNGDLDYCAGTLKCGVGEGDCDSDQECMPGLVCGLDNGPNFGMPDGYDVCWPATCTNGVQDGDETDVDSGGSCGTRPSCAAANGAADTCSAACKCDAGWGDCDWDAQCKSGLVCGTDNGPRFGMPDGYDVCVPAHCANGVKDGDETGIDCGGGCGACPAACAATNGDPNTCSALCKCDAGWGDCDGDFQCKPGLVCGTDNGARFGMPDEYDVCWPTHCQNGVKDADETGVDSGGSCGIPPSCGANGTADTCTTECKCDSGWGDCDSDAQCKSGLVCGTDNGSRFGMPDGYDVCWPAHCQNGVMDADESGIDSGGSCGTPVTCAANGTAGTCTTSCRCDAGWGDCDWDGQCKPGLVCGIDKGPRFGMPVGYDVCMPQHCTNGVRDADEAGIDCGGTACGTCEISPKGSTVTVSPASVPADGTTAATVVVTVEDALGRPIANQVVVLAYSGTASIAPASTTSDANGVATFQVTASAATTGSVTATVNPGGGEVVLTSSATLAFVPTPVCGNGVLEAGEQCDDGSLDNLDGCDATCRFEQVQRVNWLKMQFATDAFCTSNALGGAVVDSSTRTSLQAEIDSAIADGSINNIWKILYLDDLTGTNDSQIGLGIVGGIPVIPGATAYDGTFDLDWWYTSDSSFLDANRNPAVSLGGSITGNVLATGNGRLPFVLLPAHVFSLSNAYIKSTIGAASAPLISSGLPPGHLASEHLDPMLVSFATMGEKSDVGAGQLCASIAAADLVRVAIPQSITSYCTAYTVANSMLDLIVGGCKIGFLEVIKPTQPDTVDPDAPAAGAGPPYTLSASGGTAIDTCRDKDRKRVPLDICLASAAYSGYLKFATERVIAR